MNELAQAIEAAIASPSTVCSFRMNGRELHQAAEHVAEALSAAGWVQAESKWREADEYEEAIRCDERAAIADLLTPLSITGLPDDMNALNTHLRVRRVPDTTEKP